MSKISSLTPLSKKPLESQRSVSEAPKLPPLSKKTPEEVLMEVSNPVQVETPKKSEFTEREKVLPIDTGLSKVKASPSTAVFETFEGIPQNQDVEKSLLDRGFIPTEKILTRDDNGIVICNYIKVRGKLGHAAYVELDCDYHDGMGFLTVNPEDEILTESKEASVIPYSLKVGTFEANNSDLYGVGFECDNSICVMSRKDSSLSPVESVFINNNDMGILKKHPIPFPIVKMTDILANPDTVHKNISKGHSRMRNVAFNSCMKEVTDLKKYANELNVEIERFDKISSEVSNVLASTIDYLETVHDKYEKKGISTTKDKANLKAIRFNLNKRHDLVNDHIANCHSMRERAEKIRVLSEEIKALNDFSETLFTGLSSVFTE